MYSGKDFSHAVLNFTNGYMYMFLVYRSSYVSLSLSFPSSLRLDTSASDHMCKFGYKTRYEIHAHCTT